MLRDLAGSPPLDESGNEVARHDDVLDAWFDDDAMDATGL